MSERIANGATEKIYATALNAAGGFLTGLTDVLLKIRRASDGFYYDFDDTTFKSTGWTTQQEVMAELDVTNSPGSYFYNFSTALLSDDEYFVQVESATAINMPQQNELKVGGYLDEVKELWQLQGLDSANPMTTTPIARDAGSISQVITGDGISTSTITRP